MSNRPKKNKNAPGGLSNFVAVVFAEDMEQAKRYKALLDDNDVPAVIKDDNMHSTDVRGMPVMVPEDHLDEAHVLIESEDAYNDFYDYAIEDCNDDSQDDFYDDDGDFDNYYF